MGQAAGMGTGSTTAPGGAHGDGGSPTAPGGVRGGGGGCSVVPTVTLPPGRGKWEGDSEKGKGKEK